MSIAAIGLNLLLVVLLGAALLLGWRLNLRLKALRDSHEGFAKAVAELNAAAHRAEQGLAELRAASDEASDLLGSRVETARSLATRLERLIEAGGPLAAQAPDRDEQYAERPALRRELVLRTSASIDEDLFGEPAARTPAAIGQGGW
jgi:hypothetical protein